MSDKAELLSEALEAGMQDPMKFMDSLVAMDDVDFNLVSPLILESLEKTLNTPNGRLELITLLGVSGGTREEIDEALVESLKAIDEIEMDGNKKSFFIQLLGSIRNSIAETEGIAKRYLSIGIERCHDNAKIPTYAHISDSGLDLYALEDINIKPGETVLVKTGLKVNLPPGYEFQVRPKSGRSLNSKLRIANTPGTIDSGYRGEIGVIIENIEAPIKDITIDEEGKVTSILYGSTHTIGEGQKFAQIVLSEVPKVHFLEVEDILETETERGSGGFGSTDGK